MNSFDRIASTPPPATEFWYLVTPDGKRSRPYRTEQSAKGQRRRFPHGSRVSQLSHEAAGKLPLAR